MLQLRVKLMTLKGILLTKTEFAYPNHGYLHLNTFECEREVRIAIDRMKRTQNL